jgi:predicted P-loop ATPase
MSQFTDLTDVGIRYIEKGFSVIPIWGDLSDDVNMKKTPCMKSWEYYQKHIISADNWYQTFRAGNWIGMVCGQVSGNLECLDFENPFGDARERFKEFKDIPDINALIKSHNLIIETTLRGGYHLVYRCEEPIGKKADLAFKWDEKDNKKKLLIETRSEGQYFVCSPSTGYQLKYPPEGFLDTKPITMEERLFILDMAKSFNQYVEPKMYYQPPTDKKRLVNNSAVDVRPGDAYNESPESIEEAKNWLKGAGWKNDNSKYWVRPGKDSGPSATFGYVAENVFYVFSSNATPFESNRAYKPFDVLCLLMYNGDYKACAKTLREKGYGSTSDDTNASYKIASDFAKDLLKKSNKGESYSERDVQMIAKQASITEEKATAVLEKVWKRDKLMQGQDNLRTEIERIENFLQSNYEIKLNIIQQKLIIKSLKDPEQRFINVSDLMRDLLKNQYKVKRSDLDTILDSQFVDKIHELNVYFESLPAWSEKDIDYIDKYSTYFTCETDTEQKFFSIMLKKHLVRAVRCALEGFENRFVFTLIGSQEKGKSRYIRYLCPFNDYYVEMNPLEMQAKDVQVALGRNFIWNIDDLDSFTNNQIAKLKAIISKSHDNVRDVYARRQERVDRIVTFFATSNKKKLFRDESGNTRFLTFNGTINSFDYNNLKTGKVEVPIDSLWAQVFALYNNPSFDMELTAEEKNTRDIINLKYECDNFVTALLEHHFSVCEKHEDKFWSYTEIYNFMLLETKNMKELSGTEIISSFNSLNRIYKTDGKDIFVEGRIGKARGFYLQTKSETAIKHEYERLQKKLSPL